MLGSEQLAYLLFGDDTASGSRPSGGNSTSDSKAIARLALSPNASAKVLFDASMKAATRSAAASYSADTSFALTHTSEGECDRRMVLLVFLFVCDVTA